MKEFIWEQKTELVNLGNSANSDNQEAKEKFQNFVIENADQFDDQAWDMFITVTFISLEDMKKDVSFWRQIYPKIMGVDQNSFGFRTAMRKSLIEVYCEEMFDEESNEN